MRTYILKRVYQTVPILFGVSLIIFAIAPAVHQDPFAYLVPPNAPPAFQERIRTELWLDKPIPVQYLPWLKETLTGNLGYSLHQSRSITEMVKSRIRPTLLLMGAALLLATVIGLPLGVTSAMRQRSASTFALIGASLPSFFTALIGIYIFGVLLRWAPLSGSFTPNEPFSIWDRVHHLLLPAFTLAISHLAIYTRLTRTSLLEILRAGYIHTARAKGLSERAVLYRHALYNGLLHIVPTVARTLPWLCSSTIILEALFDWPGMGLLFWEAATQGDYPVLMATALFFAALVMIAHFLTDLLCAMIDPRVRADEVQPIQQAGAPPMRAAWTQFTRNRLARVGLLMLSTIILVSALAPRIAPYGQDVLTNLLYGGRAPLQLAAVCAGIALVVGFAMGALAGYAGGKVNVWIMRLAAVLTAFPPLLFAVALAVVSGPSVTSLIISITLLSWPRHARFVRDALLWSRHQGCVHAAQAAGARPWRVILRHMLPHALAPLIVTALLEMAHVLLLESTLSYLGFGIPEPTPTWGNILMKANSITILSDTPWLWVPPGLLICLTVLSLHMVASALQSALKLGPEVDTPLAA